ncbi:MAG: nucleoside-diphosphate sugar epimerase/dehydratase [Carboxydocellales bacterium]
MKKLPVSKRIKYLMLIDAGLIVIACLSGIILRFEGIPTIKHWAPFTVFTLLLVLFSLAVMYKYRIYHCMWSYASIGELLSIIKSASISSAAVVMVFYFIPWETSFLRSVIILTWVLMISFIGGSRFLWRVTRDNYIKSESRIGIKRALIVGAGDAGAVVAREFKRPNGIQVRPIGFIDDDPQKLSLQMLGLSVLGTRQDIPRLVKQYFINEIIIALPSAPRSVIKNIVNICKDTGVQLKILPGVYELINGRVSVNQIRDVQVEDLLGREPIQVDLEEIASYLKEQVVLVTGAGGSIGSELCRQTCRFNPKKLILLGHGENSIYEIEMELRRKFPGLAIETEIVDIQDRGKIDNIFEKYKPEVVFHAAAHKHVPLMEKNPEEAIKNNILGTRNVAEAADKAHAKVFVMISTDKAVNPTSVMGATKRVAEMIVQSMDKVSKTRFVAVRFGNVLGSRGSVIPLFKKQIGEGGPVTVTHPEMVRYFMTIPEATQLVIQAGAMAKGGETFILDMGEPVKIDDLARDLIRLSGLEPDIDIQVVYTGVRPGEKLYEELLTEEEGTLKTKHERILVAKPTEVALDDLNRFTTILLTQKETLTKDFIEKALKRLIPAFRLKAFEQAG